MLVINLLGGPGSGKSLTAFGLVHQLKLFGINADFVPEYAKELVYAGDLSMLEDQEHIFEVQLGRLELRRGQVEVAVCDSALVNAMVYSPDTFPVAARDRVMAAWNSFDNINFVLRRHRSIPYETAGRAHDEAAAHGVDAKVEHVLQECDIPYMVLPSVGAIETILDSLHQNGLPVRKPKPASRVRADTIGLSDPDPSTDAAELRQRVHAWMDRMGGPGQFARAMSGVERELSILEADACIDPLELDRAMEI